MTWQTIVVFNNFLILRELRVLVVNKKQRRAKMRMKLYLFALLFVSGINAQKITNVEYFVDQDPGFGSATPVNISAAAEITVNFQVDLNNISPGFHQLYVRGKDDSGRWGLPFSKPFYVDRIIPDDTKIVKIGYAIDQGPLQLIDISPDANMDEKFAVDVTGLSTGFHQLHIRSQDDNGRWGIQFSIPFYVDRIIPDDTKIVKIGYAIDQDVLKLIDISPDSNVDENFLVDLSGLSPGFHRLLVSAIDNMGEKSLIYEKSFYIDAQNLKPDITAIEYFFSNQDTVLPVITYKQFTPDKNLSLSIDLDVSGLDYNYSYVANVYGRDQTGQRGLAFEQKFKVGSMNTPPVISNLPESIRFNADSSYTLNVLNHVYDYETPDSLLEIIIHTSSDSLHTQYDTLSGNLRIYADIAYSGEDTLWIQVTDDSAASTKKYILVMVDPSTGIESETEPELILPLHFDMSQNYPNPFNPSTQIKVDLPKQEYVIIDIFNIRGQKVATLIDQEMPAGYHVLNFTPVSLPSGILFYRIHAGKYHNVKKMILIR
jgi:hypothetical protein